MTVYLNTVQNSEVSIYIMVQQNKTYNFNVEVTKYSTHQMERFFLCVHFICINKCFIRNISLLPGLCQIYAL